MEQQTERSETRTIHTTVGELIEAISQIAARATESRLEALALTSVAVNDLLQRRSISRTTDSRE